MMIHPVIVLLNKIFKFILGFKFKFKRGMTESSYGETKIGYHYAIKNNFDYVALLLGMDNM